MALPPVGPQPTELFANKTSLTPGFEYERKESKVKTDYKKKHRAPPPPTNFGQYKPKILSLDSSADVPVNRNALVKNNGNATTNGVMENSSSNRNAKPFLIGDKDTPMVLQSTPEDTAEVESKVSDLNIASDGVLFPPSDGTETRNPLFNMRTENTEPVERNGEPSGVFIPPPDYDEDETSFQFTGRVSGSAVHGDAQVYKDYTGEDFSQYLSDDEIDLNGVAMRKKRSSHATDRKSKTEAKRSQYKKRDSLPQKSSGKKKKSDSIKGESSLRNFTFADSKIGTVRQDSDNKRRSLSSLAEGFAEADVFVNSGSSYETFLRTRNGEVVSELTNENAVNKTEERSGRRHSYHSSHGKDTLWKKLTWKFKKHAQGFDLNKT